MPEKLKRFLRAIGGPWGVSVFSVVVIVATVICTVAWWPELTTNGESPSAVIRNMSLIAGGPIALAFAFWRGFIASEQADLTQLSLDLDRYYRAVEALIADDSGRFAAMLLVRTLGDRHLSTLGEDAYFNLMRIARQHDIDAPQRRAAVRSAFVLLRRLSVQEQISSGEYTIYKAEIKEIEKAIAFRPLPGS